MVPHALVPGEHLPHSMTLLLSASHAYVVGMLLYRVAITGMKNHEPCIDTAAWCSIPMSDLGKGVPCVP